MATPDASRARTRSRLRGVVPSAPMPVPEEQLPAAIGRYQVLELIGRGAMGVVYKARDPLLDRVVAVKTISAPAVLGERVRKAFLERFEREAKAAAGISHPAIVTIFDVGLDLENPYLVMEYLPGETLADRLDRGRIPLPQVVECARELASALGRAHRQRIVHRDVKPANVLDAGDGRWKLADFGIARLPDSDLTQLGTFMGTPGYSPPEAIREGRYTAQADVFGWGALFYELLCGQIPYEGPDTEATNKKVMAAEPASPITHDPSVPSPLAEVALRALAHDPAVRYADGAAVAQALARAWERTITSGAISLASFAVAVEDSPPRRPAAVRVAETEKDPPRSPVEPARPSGRPPVVARPAEAARTRPMRGVKPPGAAAPAVVRQESSATRDDAATLIRTPDEKPGQPHRRRRDRSARRLILAVIMLALVVAVLVWLTR